MEGKLELWDFSGLAENSGLVFGAAKMLFSTFLALVWLKYARIY